VIFACQPFLRRRCFTAYITLSDTLIAHVTTAGELLRTIDISSANAIKPAGLAYAPSQMNLYIVDRGVDNNSDPNENDGMVYEFSLEDFILA